MRGMAREMAWVQLFCRGSGCGVRFYICGSCYRGQVYCGERCRRRMRRQQMRVASAGISLNRRSRPGSPVGVSSLVSARLSSCREIERSLGAGILSPPVGNRLRFCWKLALAFPENGVVMSVSQYDP